MNGVGRILQNTNRDKTITHQSNLTANGNITAENVLARNSGNISNLSATNLTFNDIPYNRNTINTILIYPSIDRTGNGFPPSTNLNIRNNYGYSGWYYKNISANVIKNINWYFAPQDLGTTLVKDIKGLAVTFFNGATTSRDDALLLSIYTIPTGDDYSQLYHSSITYAFDESKSLEQNKRYQGVAICDPATISFYNETQVVYKEVAREGNYSENDKVQSIFIRTNASSPPNSVEIVASKLNVIMDNFTHKFLLVSP